MEILFFDSIDSTQEYLLKAVKEKNIHVPIAIISDEQTKGIGSRNNSWCACRGNFFVSIALNIKALPSDLPLGSASIYFAFILKKILFTFNKEVWLKWPNDLYLKSHKIGGIITNKVGNVLVCGIGVNLKHSNNGYEALFLKISAQKLLEIYIFELQKFPSWKHIFSEFEIEFGLSKNFCVHIENKIKSLEEAELCKDGSLIIDKRKVFSLR